MKTASTEREAIVAWLRANAEGWQKENKLPAIIRDVKEWERFENMAVATTVIRIMAEAIERGEHIKDQDHGRA